MRKRKITLSSKARAYISTEAKYLRQRSHAGAEKSWRGCDRRARASRIFRRWGQVRMDCLMATCGHTSPALTFSTMRSAVMRFSSSPSDMGGNATQRFLWTTSSMKMMPTTCRRCQIQGDDDWKMRELLVASVDRKEQIEYNFLCRFESATQTGRRQNASVPQNLQGGRLEHCKNGGTGVIEGPGEGLKTLGQHAAPLIGRFRTAPSKAFIRRTLFSER